MVLTFTAACLSTAAMGAGVISNTATMRFNDGQAVQTVASNSVSLTRAAAWPAKIRFTHVGSSYTGKLPIAICKASASPLRNPDGGASAEPPLAAYGDSRTYAASAPILIELTNPSGNIDPDVRETVDVVLTSAQGDVEHLTLEESSADSGVFVGAVASAVATSRPDDCVLQTDLRSAITVAYDGETIGTNDTSATALIDPFGFVFDSISGKPVNGAKVTLIDTDTGQPASVLGDDGVSAYPSTVVSGQSVTDAGGATYEGAAGRYRFPLVAAGHYRLQIEPPAAYVAPSTASPKALATLSGPDGPYLVTDSSYGRQFALDQLDPLQVDVPIDPVSQALTLDKIASTRTASPGDMIQYRLRLANRDGTMSAQGILITDTLPEGLRYRRGSTRGVAEPDVGGGGRTLTFHPGMMAPGSQIEIRYDVQVAPGAPIGEALNRAVAIIPGGARSAEGRAAVRIRALLNTDAMTIIGRVTEGDCGLTGADRKGVPGVRLLMEDGTYVVTDREGLYHIEGVRKGRHVVQLDKQTLKPGLIPLGCQQDTRSAGRSFSRFVEGQGGSLQRVDFALRRDPTIQAAADKALVGEVIDDARAAGNDTDWLEGQAPGIDWLFPAMDHNPRAPVLRVVIKHLPGQSVALFLNGAPVDVLARDQGDGNGSVVIAKWTGLPLHEGDNRLEARVSDAAGTLVKTLARTVHYANTAAHVDYLPARSVLVADGITRPLVAVRLTDRDGKPVRAGTPVAFTIDQPYTAAVEAAAQDARPLQGLGRALPFGRVIGDDGVALVALQPTSQAGAAHMTFTLSRDGEKQQTEIRPWLQAAARDWVVVGFGAGTVGHDILSGKARAVSGLSKNDTFTDGQVAFYAKGRITGSWLLTIAYDSNRRIDPDRGLLGVIDPDRYYTVYGDGTQQGYDAPTRGKLYLRLERRQFYALFGDYQTNLTQTQLARFSRTLNGFKGEFHGRTISFTGFAANSTDQFGRDEIQGSGLSGPYRLRSGAIVPNSEQVSLETRDRFRSELIVETRVMTRHIDYDVDPDAGTLVFKTPVAERDAQGNPIFIVVNYEVFGNGGKRLVAGGRTAVTLAKGRVEIGATVLRDESQGKSTVGGVDLKARITRTTEVRAEAAAGGDGGNMKDRAYIAEVEHRDSRVDMRAYVRQQDKGYGLGQQNVVEAGTRKYGADGGIRLSDRISLKASAWHQESLTGPAKRDAVDARAEWRADGTTLHAGFQFADDQGVANVARKSELIAIGGTKELFDRKLAVSAENQFALGGHDDSVDFPVRRTLGASYKLTEFVHLIAGYEKAEGARYSARSIRAGLDVAPWAGAKLSSTVNQDVVGENGPRSYAQFGLAQALPIGNHWTIDGAVDSSKTVKGRIPAADLVNPLHPVSTVGSLGQDGNPNEDYMSMSFGAAWQRGSWSWNGRAERRTSDSSARWGVTSNLMRRLGQGKTIASTIRVYRIRDRNGKVAEQLSADIALAWRPLDSRWAMLDRVEYRHERGDAGVSSSNLLGVGAANGAAALSTRIINNLAVNYRTAEDGDPQRWEAALYYGAKYVRGRFDDDRFDGLIDVTGFDLRRAVGRRLDVTVSVTVQHAWDQKTLAYSFGPSVGISPKENMWVSIGYNVKGFHDRDFEDNRYLRQGPYVTMRVKFDQQSLSGVGTKLKGMFR